MSARARAARFLRRRVGTARRTSCLLLAVVLSPPAAGGRTGLDAEEVGGPFPAERRGAAVATVGEDEVRSLMSWATRLSGYAPSATAPEVRLEPSTFFAAHACGGRTGACRVLGWYADRGIVHIHERFAALDSLFARSLLVHELVHYLQHRSGRFADGSCESFVAREREAYAVQQRFFVAYGAVPAIRPHHFGCPAPPVRAALVGGPGK